LEQAETLVSSHAVTLGAYASRIGEVEETLKTQAAQVSANAVTLGACASRVGEVEETLKTHAVTIAELAGRSSTARECDLEDRIRDFASRLEEKQQVSRGRVSVTLLSRGRSPTVANMESS
jgi:hypothetical protein